MMSFDPLRIADLLFVTYYLNPYRFPRLTATGQDEKAAESSDNGCDLLLV